jgi:MYXO-CTERM domain-containing protein
LVAIEHRLAKWGGYLNSVPDRRSGWLVAGILTFAAAAMVLLLLLPGKTVATQHLWDIMTFIDAADRVNHGQVPNRDFHSPLGPLAYQLLGMGAALSGGFAGMMPASTALFVPLLLPLVIYASLSRMPWLLALLFGLYILILSISPLFIGQIQPGPSWGMFYNRWGWGLLSLLFLFVLPRRRPLGREVLDMAAMATIWLLLFYLKTTFAAIGAAFLVALIWFPHVRRAAPGAIAGAAIAVLIVELFWGGTLGYISDIQTAASATGAVRGGVLGLFATLVNNVQGAYLFAAVLLLALLGRVRYDYMLVCLFMGAAGILLDRHNAQGPGILTFIPGALIAILAPRRGESDTAAAPSLASVLLAMAIAVPVVVMGAANVAFHFVTAEGAPSGNIAVAGLQGIIAPDAPTSTPNQPGALAAGGRAADVCGLVDALPNLQANKGEHPLSPTQILAFVADGAALLQRTPQLVGKAFVPDLGNPLNALAGRPAPRGAEAFNDAEITFSKAVHRPAEQLFADAEVLMIPKFAQKYATFDLMRQIYGAYWAANFELVARSPCWDGYRRIRRPAPAARPGT